MRFSPFREAPHGRVRPTLDLARNESDIALSLRTSIQTLLITPDLWLSVPVPRPAPNPARKASHDPAYDSTSMGLGLSGPPGLRRPLCGHPPSGHDSSCIGPWPHRGMGASGRDDSGGRPGPPTCTSRSREPGTLPVHGNRTSHLDRITPPPLPPSAGRSGHHSRHAHRRRWVRLELPVALRVPKGALCCL